MHVPWHRSEQVLSIQTLILSLSRIKGQLLFPDNLISEPFISLLLVNCTLSSWTNAKEGITNKKFGSYPRIFGRGLSILSCVLSRVVLLIFFFNLI